MKALRKHPALPGEVPHLWPKAWTSNATWYDIFLLPLLLIAVSHVNHSCYCSKRLFLSHRKYLPPTSSALENYNLNYTRWLHKQKTGQVHRARRRLLHSQPVCVSQLRTTERGTGPLQEGWGPQHITACKMWVRWISRAALKAKRSQSRSDSCWSLGGRRAWLTRSACGDHATDFPGSAGFPVLDARPHLAAWWVQT